MTQSDVPRLKQFVNTDENGSQIRHGRVCGYLRRQFRPRRLAKGRVSVSHTNQLAKSSERRVFAKLGKKSSGLARVGTKTSDFAPRVGFCTRTAKTRLGRVR